jgi:hypothetical protein
MEKTCTDDIGRIFCERHKRELCHECCFDFGPMNRNMEAGLRKKTTPMEQAAED